MDDDGGARGALGEAEAELSSVEAIDPELDSVAEQVRAVSVELDDAGSALRSYADGIEAEPERLEQLEERLTALDRLKRKHGGTTEAVLAHAEHCRTEIERLENAEELAAELEGRLASAAEQRATIAGELAKARAKAAKQLERRVADELEALAMEGASVEVRIEPHPDGFGASGSETVEFLVATNPGIPASPLRDAASGGELSRIMLALTALGAGGGAGTVVFDEIDAGIGGNTARAVGEKLRQLGSRAPADLHHAPAPGGVAGRRALSDRQGLRRQERAGDGREGGRRGAGRRDRAHARRQARRRGGEPPRARAARRRLGVAELLVPVGRTSLRASGRADSRPARECPTWRGSWPGSEGA